MLAKWKSYAQEILRGDYTNLDSFMDLHLEMRDDSSSDFQQEKDAIEKQADSNSNALLLAALFERNFLLFTARLDKAVEANNTKAMILRATAYLEDSTDEPTETDKILGFKLLERAIALNDSAAMTLYGTLHYNIACNIHRSDELQFNKCLNTAIEALESAADLENPEAMLELATIHYQEKREGLNLAKGRWLYERAIRSIEPDQVIQSTNASINNSINGELAQNLLELVWDDLIAGKSFSADTIGILTKNCQDAVLQRLINAPQGSSLHQLKSIKDNPTHPISLILELRNPLNQEYFIKLRTHFYSQFNTRLAFFRAAPEDAQNCPFNSLSVELKHHIFSSFVQPGLEEDRKNGCFLSATPGK